MEPHSVGHSVSLIRRTQFAQVHSSTAPASRRAFHSPRYQLGERNEQDGVVCRLGVDPVWEMLGSHSVLRECEVRAVCQADRKFCVYAPPSVTLQFRAISACPSSQPQLPDKDQA